MAHNQLYRRLGQISIDTCSGNRRRRQWQHGGKIKDLQISRALQKIHSRQRFDARQRLGSRRALRPPKEVREEIEKSKDGVEIRTGVALQWNDAAWDNADWWQFAP